MILLLSSAFAQDGLDGHHFRPVPGYGAILDPVQTWTPVTQNPGAFGVQALVDGSGPSLVRVDEDWNGATETTLLEQVVALNVGARVAVSRRLGLTVHAPLYLTSTGANGPQGAGIGDIRLAAPIGLLLPDGPGLGLSVIPMIDLPTGDTSAFLGATGVGAGAVAALGWDGRRASADFNLGYGHEPESTFANHPGGGRLLGAVGAGYALTDSLGIRGEVVLDSTLSPSSLSPGVAPGTDSPAEALASLRGHTDGGLSWTAGGGAGVSAGAGAPAWRAFAGVSWAWLADPNQDPDLDGVLGSADACPRDPEAVNGWKDADGCPDALSVMSLVVRDEEGKRLGAAQVLTAGAPRDTAGSPPGDAPGDTPGDATTGGGTQAQGVVGGMEVHSTGPDGTLQLPPRSPDMGLSVVVRVPGYVDGRLTRSTLGEGAAEETLTLAWLPGTTRVTAVGPDGKGVAATVALKGPTTVPPLALGADGTRQTVLPAGRWELLATAEGLGTEGRTVDIVADKPGLQKVAFVLTPAKVEVKQKEVAITEAVLFDFNAATLRDDSAPLLRQVAGQLLAHPEITKVEVQGYTDNVGESPYNLALSQQRVDAVVASLVSLGVAPERLVAKGYGEARPIASNATEAGQAKNRRVQFVILEQAAAPVEGAKK